MEYFPSGDLRSFIRGSGPLAEDDAMIIARQLAGGLRMLHEENFTHRDLKLEVRLQRLLASVLTLQIH